jgi:hypothetical protein
MIPRKQMYCPLFFTFIFILSFSCEQKPQTVRQTLDLSGEWQLRLDPNSVGMAEQWFAQTLEDTVILPGSLDENKKGMLNRDSTDMHLNRLYSFIGAAWYRKEIQMPLTWEGKRIELIMERTKVTHVWLDTLYMGSDNTLFSRQIFDLTGKLTTGKHALTILVDNDPDLVPVETSHAYEENTQTNWNGILGRFCLEASNPVRLDKVKIFPNIHSEDIIIKLSIENPEMRLKRAEVVLRAESWNSGKIHKVPEETFSLELGSSNSEVLLPFHIGPEMQLWSEFDPALYKLFVTLKNGDRILDNVCCNFGMREFKTEGTRFSINGLKTFLRGKMEACVFPLTGYPPMEKEEWMRVLRIAKAYGLNHYRFHSYTPPAAAFAAADLCGFYFQPELPVWQKFNAHDSSHVAFMMKEGKRILDSYGNSPSLVMFALGNEIHRDRRVLQQMVADFREYDARPLYAQGSNNHLGNPKLAEGDDYWTTFRTGKKQADHSTDVRGSFSFLDSDDGGVINAFYPSTNFDFSDAIKGIPVPVIGHEVGQYQIYPDFAEMKKYTGVLKPWNFEIFRQGIQEKGMLDQAPDFHKASGQLALRCYREEIEMALRTPGIGGFQLLDLQDFPGQGTALVGILDAFMDSKGLTTPEEFRQFCSDVVLLAVMDKYCREEHETFSAEIKIANFGPEPLTRKYIEWKIVDADSQEVLRSGRLNPVKIPQGELISLGKIETTLRNIGQVQKAFLQLDLVGSEIKTHYPLWIYPPLLKMEYPKNLIIANRFDNAMQNQLEAGKKVLLFPDFKRIEKNSVGGLFIPDFWNYAMFKMLAERNNGGFSPGTLGLLTDPTHALFNDFPTDFHSNWQWWAMIKNSRPIILDNTTKNYRPIVQVVDNINRNHKLGLIFEFKVGEGKLLICASNLPAITDKPEARQLYRSILNYMDSEAFNPEYDITIESLKMILGM